LLSEPPTELLSELPFDTDPCITVKIESAAGAVSEISIFTLCEL